MMKTRLVTFGLAIAIGLLGGYAIRAMLHSESDDGDVAISEAAGADEGAAGSAAGRLMSAAGSSRARSQEKADLVDSTGVTRWLHWVASLEDASLDEMVRLAEFTKGDRTAQEMLAARWLELGPRHFFDSVAGGALERSIPVENLRWLMLQGWAELDLYALAEALQTSDAPAIRSMRSNIVGRVIHRDAELGLKLFYEWGMRSHRPRMTAVEQWARRDPLHAAKFVIAHQSGIVTEAAAEVVGKIWAEADPKAALEFAQESPSLYSYKIAEEALGEWAKRDFSAAADWLGGADPITHARMAAAFAGAWAESDPEAALDWTRQNLTGQPYADALAGAVRALVEKDLSEAARMVSKLDPSRAKSAAAVEVAKKWLPDWDSKEPLTAEAVAWMGGLDRESLGRVLDRVSWQWSRTDHEGFAEFLTRPEAERVSESTVHSMASRFARHDPKGAMAWAQTLPEANVTPAARAIFRSWHRSQPEVAMDWLGDVPESPGRGDELARAAARGVVESAGTR